MKTITAFAVIAAGALLTGCVNSPVNLAWRGVVHDYQQEATTEGSIANTPTLRDTAVNAEKTTDVTADVPITK
jgi:outer membrane murein-binding lipoprotein Lpp